MQNQNGNGILEQYTGSLSQHIQTEYSIPPKYYRGDLKLGLRNSDGTGVPIGVTRVGSVLGYMIARRRADPRPRPAVLPRH